MDRGFLVVFALCLGAVACDVVKDQPKRWVVEDTTKNVTCLMAEMNVRANFSYQLNGTNALKSVIVEIPADAEVNKTASSCGDKNDTLNVVWGQGNCFELVFERVNSTYDLSSFVITLNVSSIFNDSSANQTIKIAYMQPETFKVPTNFSYHCNHEQVLNATDKDEKFIVLSKVQFEAFKLDNTKKFSLAKDCESNVTPDIVPIAVGLSLIALIIIVLIAFIVGRRRSQARGYLNIM